MAFERHMASPDTQQLAAILQNLIATNRPQSTSSRIVVAAAITAHHSQPLRTTFAPRHDFHNYKLSQDRSITAKGDLAHTLGSASTGNRSESQEGPRQLLPDGSPTTTHLQYVAMENFLPALCGSDESDLSTTQENDPSVHARFLENAADGRLAGSQAPGLLRIASTQDHEPATTGTGISYDPDHTDHLTLDYQPSPVLESSFRDFSDHTANGKASSQRTGRQLPDVGLIEPQTPALPKLVLGRPGTVLGLSQMFALTQPSPGSRGQEALIPTSRPSPGMFNHQRLPKDSSSPLIGRGVPIMPMPAVDLDSSSPPVRSSPGPVVNKIRAVNQQLPELLYDYRSRKESQEQRRNFSLAQEDDGVLDDDFLDDGPAFNRRVKRKKEKAARELASVGTSRLTSTTTGPVEVPSTNNRQRRTTSEDYQAQCSGYDARDSQQDDIIADSQSPLVQREKQDRGDKSSQGLQEKRPDSKRSGHMDYSQEAHTSSAKVVESEISEQLPGLDQAEDSNATESERETSEPRMSQSAISPLGEVSSNIPELRTPAVQKKVLYPDRDARVPETSPLEPHIQRFGEIVSQSPPVLSAEGIDDSFNPLTQDDEFNRAVKSPTPQGRMQPMNTKRVQRTQNLAPQRINELGNKVTVGEPAAAKPVEDRRESTAGNEAEPSSACLRDTSEYVTAPTSLPSESLGAPNLDEKIRSYRISPSREDADLSKIEQSAIRAGVHSMQDAGLPVENPNLLSTPDSFRHAAAGESESGIITSTNVLSSRVKVTTGSLSKSGLHALSNPTKRLAGQRSDEAISHTVPQPSPDPSASSLRRLRSASQVRGSARSLRRSTGNGIVIPAATMSFDGTPPPNSRQSPRSSRQASVTSNGQVMGNKPQEQVKKIVSPRRKPMQTRPAIPLLFDGMAFSVSYVSRDNEKKNVLRLIEQNGGRVLNLGFDELFDMSAIKLASAPRNPDNRDSMESFGLTPTPQALTIGFACLLADEHSRKVKFMQALALGLPCISGRWIEHCVDKGMILDWDSYLLPAGESAFLGGAVRNRSLQPYSAVTSKFSERFDQRPQMLTGKSILLVMSKGRLEERKKAYVFLTQALGAKRVKRVHNNTEARKFLLEAEAEGEEWNWIYVDDNEKNAEKAIFGQRGAPKKRKRGFTAHGETEDQVQAPKKIKIISDEYVIQSLILGKLLEE